MGQLSSIIRARFVSLLDKHLPSRTKRLIFMASFSARLQEATVFDNETLYKLNRLLVLSSSDSSLKLPIHLSKAIWNGKTAVDICSDNVCEGQLNKERIKRVAQCVIKAMPAWLRYGDNSKIEQDVERLLDNRSVVLV